LTKTIESKTRTIDPEKFRKLGPRPRLRTMAPGKDATLGQLRRQLRKTQAEVASAMGTEQDRVSRLERRADMRVSSLRDYVAAMGGTLRLVVELPEGDPVTVHLPPARRTRTSRPRPDLKTVRGDNRA
jgi:hypothetical protein